MSNDEFSKDVKEVRKLADGSCLLLSTSDNIQTNLLQSMLAESEIPFLVKNQGMGTYLKVFSGQSFYPTDIYVNPEDYDRAKELLDSYFSESEMNSEMNNDSIADDSISVENEENPSYRRGRKAVRLFIIIVLLLNLAALSYGIISLIINILCNAS